MARTRAKVAKQARVKTGRPLLDIDAKVVEGMASIGATNIELADYFGCSSDTIERRFAVILAKSRASAKIRLRRLQWAAAAKGDRTMLVWLGKQVLGQTDRAAVEMTGKDGAPIEVKVDDVRDRIARRVTGIASRMGANGHSEGPVAVGTGGAGA